MKEKKIATEIIAVSIGNKACQETLRTAMAMGADRAIHIETNLRTDQELQPLAVAKTLKFVAEVRVFCCSFFISILIVAHYFRKKKPTWLLLENNQSMLIAAKRDRCSPVC